MIAPIPLLAILLAVPAPAPAAAPAGGALVLDQSAYFRTYVQFGIDRLDGDVLAAEGQKILGADGLKRLRRRLGRWCEPPFAPAEAEGKVPADPPFWVTQVANVGCDDERVSFHVHCPPPPAAWASPQFDAGAWPRQRLPLLVGNICRPSRMHGDVEMQQFQVRAGFYRAAFRVDDPAAGYELSLAFRGGARVWINGRELARSGLPAGELAADTPAESYPADAYLCRPEEANPARVERTRRHAGGEVILYCPDLVGRFQDAAVDARQASEYWHDLVSRAGWDRITKLRDRRIGPLRIPPQMLTRGPNLLAVEIRAARLHPIVAANADGDWGRSYYMGANFTWSHCRLLELQLRCADPAAPAAMARPAGTQVWVEDPNRRLYADDFGEPAAAPGVLRIVAARNGTHGGQVAVGTDRTLSPPRVSAGPLALADGSATLAADAIHVLFGVPHPVSEMVQLGQWRGLPEIVSDPMCPTSEMALLRHGPPQFRERMLPHDQRAEAVRRIEFFDHLSRTPPLGIAAGRCQPIWISVRVPAEAKAGVYRGRLRIEAEGMAAAEVPVEVEVLDWSLPAPAAFQSVCAAEQSPYGVAKQYGVPLWSDRHFELMAASFQQIDRLGARWVFVPVIQWTEFGNLADSPVLWRRTADGRLAFDFSRLDRYLALATRGWADSAGPKVICFVVAHGTDAGAKATVNLLDEASGKTETLDLSPASPQYRDAWKAFATALFQHMEALGLERAMHWGFGWDGIGDAALLPLLAECVPDAARWARGSHAPNRAPGGWERAFVAHSFIYSVPVTELSQQGWRQKDLVLVNPRAGCSVISANGHSPPLAYRVLMDRALVAGTRGLGRLGADYWAGVFYQGYEGRAWAGSLPGMGCLSLLWPGEHGADPSQRMEVLLEGIQEAEARIFLEQALAWRDLPEDLAARVRDVLDRHHRETLYIPVGRIGVQIEEYAAGWQDRSRRLFAAAAEVARLVPLDVDRTQLDAQIPARGRGVGWLTLRNWTGRPRAWRISADQPWVRPRKTSGTLTGCEAIRIEFDGSELPAGGQAAATLTVTDLAAGRAFPLPIAATVGRDFWLVVGPAYDYLGAPAHASSWTAKRIEDFATFNVPVGGAEMRQFVFLNHAGVPMRWRIESPVDWVKVAPAAGTLPAGGRTEVNVTASPPDAAAASHELTLQAVEIDGPARQQARLVVHVIPPYAAPAAVPAGRPVPLRTLPREMIVEHRSRAYWYGTSDRSRDDFGPAFDEQGGISGGCPQRTVYDIEGKGFTAFSATVQCPAKGQRVGEGGDGRLVGFEVLVDGRLAAQSGLMEALSGARRTLVVEHLAGAKRIELRVRYDRPEAKYLGGTVATRWIDPKFYRAE